MRCQFLLFRSMTWTRRFSSVVLSGCISSWFPAPAECSDDSVGFEQWVSFDDAPALISIEQAFATDEDWVQPASFLQPPPLLRPQPSILPQTPLPPAGERLARARERDDSLLGRLRTRSRPTVGITETLPSSGTGRTTTDAGSLLRQSSVLGGISTQRRTPIVHDPRVRGSRVGQLASSGSYWLPARIDLTTPLSNFDSQIISEIQVTKGPYDVRQGPGLNFVAVDLVDSPRFDMSEMHGSTRLDYHTNGKQWHGRQVLQGGSEQWGFQLGYTQRVGSDYATGDGTSIPSSFNSRAWDLAIGRDFSDDRRVEVHALRLDQTDVEFPSQAFDISALGTNGYEVEFTQLNAEFADRLEAEAWFNNTRFAGDTGGQAKRQVFPTYQQLNVNGTTAVASISTGARIAADWETDTDGLIRAGIDLRHVQQRLDEFVTYRRLGREFAARSPIPETAITNPGIFVDYSFLPSDDWRLKTGSRIDAVSTNIIDDSLSVRDVGTDDIGTPINERQTIQEYFGTTDLNRNYTPWAAFVTSEYQLGDTLSLTIGAGHSERTPSATELYAAQPFMFLLQNGLNTVRGDPHLDTEKQTQIDAGINLDSGRFRAGGRGFYAWINDYITFENIGTVPLPGNPLAQVNLQYVNTNLATLSGFETQMEFDILPQLTTSASLSYVEGTDQTRNGAFATDEDGVKYPGLPRGAFGQATDANKESLPGIVPLEGRLALKLHDNAPLQAWWIELSSRMVAPQNKVAASLFEATSPGFIICDLRGALKVSDHFSTIAGVENLTNASFREHLDFHTVNGLRVLQPGVNFYIGSEFRY